MPHNSPAIGDLNWLPAGVLYSRHSGIIVAANAVLLQWLGYVDTEQQYFSATLNAGPLQHTELSQLFTGAGRIYNLTHIQPALQQAGKVEEMYVQLQCSKGTTIALVVNAQRFENYDVYVFTPIAKRHSFEAELIAARKDAEQAQQDTDKAYQQLRLVQEQLQETNRELAALASTDVLTGLANRRSFQHTLQQQIAHCNREGSELALLVLDIDHFKSINDEGGHDKGDQTLERFAEVAQECSREDELLARTGGEEFAMILVGANEQKALQAAERMRVAIAAASFPFKPITVSIGVAIVVRNDSPQAIYMRADQALYQAKRNGRNRVELATS